MPHDPSTRWIESTRRQVNDAFAGLSADDVDTLVDEAVAATRKASRSAPPTGA